MAHGAPKSAVGGVPRSDRWRRLLRFRLPSPAALGRRLSRLGLQRRIMVYVTVGLSVMFGVAAVVGFGAIDQATDLVYAERLATAHTTASILERDFERLASRAREETREAAELAAGGATPGNGAGAVLRALSETDVSPFFSVSGVWMVDASGEVAASAGVPSAEPPVQLDPDELPATVADDGWAVTRAFMPVDGAIAFAAVYVKLDGSGAALGPAIIVNTISVNSTVAYVPAAHGRTVAGETPSGSETASEAYHLEVVDPDGIAVLGVGEDERPGETSPHAEAITTLVSEHGAAALLHEPESGEPHVMAVVPLATTPFYVVLEQPVDVALALPEQLRERLFLWVALGLAAALVVAWVTTRRVVKPTEELTDAANRIAGGDLASPITVRAQDEIGQLAGALDLMRDRLREAHEGIERTNRELESRVAQRTARLGEALRQTISAQEDERARLARELHDETAQTLGALSIALDRAREELSGEGGPAAGHIVEAEAIATRLLAEIRQLILGLRPAILDDLGLVPALRLQSEVALGESGVQVSIAENLGSRRLPAPIEVSLFRIVQEALTNVGRHAQAHNVDVELREHDGAVSVTVADDGRGFDPAQFLDARGRPTSVGLIGMQERVALLGGRLSIDSGPGRGTSVLVEVPLTGAPLAEPPPDAPGGPGLSP
jgi:signal transduction histidine kinase